MVLIMAFEGEHKVIPLRGIERAGADEVIQDGACQEIVGLEMRDGSFVPYKPNRTEYFFTAMKPKGIWIHETSSQENVIVLIEDELMWAKRSELSGALSDRKSVV